MSPKTASFHGTRRITGNPIRMSLLSGGWNAG
jgi:hypothetical protein